MMSSLIPNNAKNYLKLLPTDNSDSEVQAKIEKFRNMYGDKYVESIIWTQEDAKSVLAQLGFDSDSCIYNFYLNVIDLPECYRSQEIYGLSEILDDYKTPFWGQKYPNIQDRYLLLSSIEGEFSYFYDKDSDAVYGVDWGDMSDFVAGSVNPIFDTFYSFLEWYYSEEDED